MGKRLHRFQIGNDLFCKRGLFAARFRLLFEKSIGVGGDIFRDEQGQGRDEHHHQRDLPAERQHEGEGAENGHDARKKLRKAHQKPVGELVGVRDDAAHRIAVGMGIEIFEGEPRDLGKSVRANVLYHLEGDLVVEYAHQPLRDGGDRHRSADFEKDDFQGGKIHLPFIHNTVYGVPDENGHVQRESHRDDRQNQSQRKGKGIFSDVAQHLFQRALAHFRLRLRRLFFAFFLAVHARASFSSSSALYCES